MDGFTIIVVPHVQILSDCIHALADVASLSHDWGKVNSASTSFEAFRRCNKPVFVIGGRSAAETAESVRRIRRQNYSARIVVIGAGGEARKVIFALRSGASAYIAYRKEKTTLRTLAEAIGLIAGEEASLEPKSTKRLPDHGNSPAQNTQRSTDLLKYNSSGEVRTHCSFTAREETILRGLAEGARNKAIANKLGLTEGTVKVYVKSILRKIEVKNRIQAAAWALKYHEFAEALPRVQK